MTNAAIYYQPEGFSTDVPTIMGRQSAGEGFLKAFMRYSSENTLYCYACNQQALNNFVDRKNDWGAHAKNVSFIPYAAPWGLLQPGALFFPGPNISRQAWLRRRLGQRGFSITGVTHTLSSEAAMQSVCDLITAPVQSWDAVICTSTVAQKTMKHILENYSSYLKDRLGAAHPICNLQLPLIPLGVDCEAYAQTEHSNAFRANWRLKLGIGENDIAVLFVGRLSAHAKANPHPMYVALERSTKETGRKIHLIQAGWFANKFIDQSFKDSAGKLAPSVIHHFLDSRQSSIHREIWFSADIFCSLSDNIQETFGLTPIEALAAGLPLVVSDWNGYKDTVRNGVDGFRIKTTAPKPGQGDGNAFRFEAGEDNYDTYCGNASQAVAVDIDDATKAFVMLIQNPELRMEMGNNARKRAQNIYDWKHIIKAYEELWKELAKRRLKDPEIAAVSPDHLVQPMRDDPFSLFSSYPTRHAEENDRFKILSSNLSADFLTIGKMHIHSDSASYGYMTHKEESTKIAEFLNHKNEITVPQIAEHFPGIPQSYITKLMLWMYKVGLVKI